MRCAIFIRSYWKDLDWLNLCLASIDRYCHGFSEVVVVLPKRSHAWARRRAWPRVRLEAAPDYSDDYLGQQITKLYADRLTDAEFICHLDSDCLMCRPTEADELCDSGLSEIVIESVEKLGRHHPWQQPTERFFGHPIAYDFMRRPPFVYPRWLYGELRDDCLRRHGVDLGDYIAAQPPRGFSEFNALGALAWYSYRDQFNFVDVAQAGPERCRWFWSWGGIEAVRWEIAEIIGAS